MSRFTNNGKNHLYYGDNLDNLRRFVPDESVDLCYIDPPFNSKRNYNQIYTNVGKEDAAQAQAFIDTWNWDDLAIKGFSEIVENLPGLFTSQTINLIIGLEKILGQGSLLAYLVSMTLRVAEIYRVLKPTGSFYFHCDPTSSHYLKLVLDSVFCSQGGNFQSEIIWRRTGSHNKVKRFAPIHDVIFFYTKSNKYTWNYPKRPYMMGHIKGFCTQDEDGYKTKYYGNVLTGSGKRGGLSGQPWKGFDPDKKGRHWAIPGALLDDLNEDISHLNQHEKLDYLHDLGFIKILENKDLPIYERYLKPSDGQALSDIWAFQPYTDNTVFGIKEGIDRDVKWLSPKDKERLGYETQKPEALLERIIQASSNEGDVILDAYCGCGTSVAVAQRLNRRWIGIDITYQSVSLILKRLEDTHGVEVLNNVIISGVPRDIKSAEALANRKDDRTRKEFEKWAVLTYSKNRAAINQKKGADQGVDGKAFFPITDKDFGTILFQVKSGKVDSRDIRDLVGTMSREKADLGIFITLKPPTEPMRKEAKSAGLYHYEFFSLDIPRIKIVTVEDILNSAAQLDVPLIAGVLKAAARNTSDGSEQLEIIAS